MAEQEYEGALNDARREAMEKGRLAGREEGREEGARRTAIENAKNMLRDKMPVGLIAKYSGISIEQVKSISI